MDDDGFTIVKTKGRAPRRRPPSCVNTGEAASRIAYETRGQASSSQRGFSLEEKLDKVLAILQTRRRQLLDDEQGVGKENTFLKRWKDQMSAVRSTLIGQNDTDTSTTSPASPPVQIVCLGIGIINESRESQFQFVLLDMLKEALGIPPENVWVYDPLFQPVDLALLARRSYQLIPNNECGKHKLDPRYHTLVYMPHCPGKLYDAFLRENWDQRIACGHPESLDGDAHKVETERCAGRMVLLANDFRGYVENASRSRIEKELPSVFRLTPHLSTLAFPTLSSGHVGSNAFNSLIFQYVATEAAEKVDWTTVPPVGCDKEGVTETEVIACEIQGDLDISMSLLSLKEDNHQAKQM